MREKDSGRGSWRNRGGFWRVFFGVWAVVERDFSGIPLLLERVCFLCVGEEVLKLLGLGRTYIGVY